MLRPLFALAAAVASVQAFYLPLLDPSKVSKNSRGKNWAVIVVGSDGWFNYRHQADAAHAYQIFKKNGFPADNIIMMMADDVANNDRNPEPGTLINKPGGPNVYDGVKVDFSGKDVTPDNFKKILLGQHVGSGNKTLRSGPNDNVFVNFVDHGGVGLIAFPAGAMMTSNELVDTLKKMHDKRMYGNLVFFMEACEGGSMFENLLPTNINIYAHTAANPSQSSYATYWDATRKTFLGDAYSVAWMEDADEHFSKSNPPAETLHQQFQKVYKRIESQSQPVEYGDKSMGNRHVIDEFLAYGKNGLEVPENAMNFIQGGSNGMHLTAEKRDGVLVDSRDVKVFALTKMLQENSDSDPASISAKLEAEYQKRQAARDRFYNLAYLVAGAKADEYVDNRVSTVVNHDCLSDSIVSFHTTCHPIDDYHIAYTRVLAHMCDNGYSAEEISMAMAKNPLCIHA
eukprot:comp22759_c0_seq1/m.35547 comp22759_c0_seq1/g.35547  ORF comp22759_c0_seq1/g.35547 comp22759_c0_seq1/m.35547 type:complete len:455 (-) comp22759_c0_seq1:454-1818(-)